MNLPRNIANIDSASVEPIGWSDLGLSARPQHDDIADRITLDLRVLCGFWPMVLIVKLAALLFYNLAETDGLMTMSSTAVALACVTVLTDLSVWILAKVKWFGRLPSH